MTERAAKNDKMDKKPDVSLVYKETIYGCAKAMMAGEVKYGRFNYAKGHTASQLLAAAIRHLQEALWKGDVDEDCTELLGQIVEHLDCATANINMFKHQRDVGTLVDDRFWKRKESFRLSDEQLPETLVTFKDIDNVTTGGVCAPPLERKQNEN
jgi:hypothetical protein